MSVEATAWVYKYSPYKGTRFLVHLAIADKVNEDHDMLFWMRQTKLANRVRVHRATVGAHIQALIDDEFLELVENNSRNGRDDPNKYRFLMPDCGEQYDSHTRTGVPGSSPDSFRTVSARQHQMRQQRDEHEAANPPLPLDNADVPPGSGYRDGNGQVSLLHPPGEDTHEDFSDSDSGPGAEVIAVSRNDSDSGDVVDAELVQDQHTQSAMDELNQRYEEFPDVDVSDDPATIKMVKKEALGFYIDWRRLIGAGDIRIGAWKAQISQAVGTLVERGIPPQRALDAVTKWHDINVENAKKGEMIIRPGAIVTCAESLRETDKKFGVDGFGTTAKAARVDDHRDGLAALKDMD